MDSPTEIRHRSRPRAGHVFLTLVALISVAAIGSQLWRTAPQGPGIAATATRPLALSRDGSGAAPLAADAAVNLTAPDVALAATEPEALVAESEGRADDALIVRTASLELEASDITVSLREARIRMTDLGGYVSGSDAYDQGESRWAMVTYRVPVVRFAEAIDALRGLADRVVRESTQSVEVTGSVMDLDARIVNLRASEAALAEIMGRAGRIDDVLAVQMRLEDVRGQIEQLEAQRAHLADQAALSTVTVSWTTPVAAVSVAREGWDLAREIDAALAQTVQALQGAVSLAVWLIVVVLPLLGVPLLLALAVLLVRRRGQHGQPGPTLGPGPDAARPAAAD